MIRRWVADWWRVLMLLLAAVLVAYLGVLVVTGIEDRGRALNAATLATRNEQQARVSAARQIDQLLAEIAGLQRVARVNGGMTARLIREIDFLQQQVRDLGGQPVDSGGSSGAAPGSEPPTSPTATRTPRPGPSPSPSRTPTHRPTPAPSPSRTFCIPVITC